MNEDAIPGTNCVGGQRFERAADIRGGGFVLRYTPMSDNACMRSNELGDGSWIEAQTVEENSLPRVDVVYATMERRDLWIRIDADEKYVGSRCAMHGSSI